MSKKNPKKAKMYLEKIRQLMSKIRSPYEGKNKQEIINEIRKIREKLWEEKLASYSR